MADHTRNSMQSAIRSMREVVIPALDPQHPLAREQAGLVLKYLEFWADRVDQLAERNRAELTCYVAMAAHLTELTELAAAVSSALAAVIGQELATGRTVLADHGAPVQSTRDAVAGLTRAISALVRTADAQQAAAADAIGRVVVEHSRDVALLQRAWFGPQAWEDPLPPALDDVLRDILAEGAPVDHR